MIKCRAVNWTGEKNYWNLNEVYNLVNIIFWYYFLNSDKFITDMEAVAHKSSLCNNSKPINLKELQNEKLKNKLLNQI